MTAQDDLMVSLTGNVTLTLSTKPSGTVSTLSGTTSGLHYTRMDAEFTRAWYDRTWLQGWYCARCEQRVLYDRDGYRKNRGKGAWVHLKNSQPWCLPDKQHGPKTRRVLPVPSLYVINEIGYLHA